jgi:hypothetical protein
MFRRGRKVRRHDRFNEWGKKSFGVPMQKIIGFIAVIGLTAALPQFALAQSSSQTPAAGKK